VTGTRVVIVMGGDPADRSHATAELLLDDGGTALILTGDPDAVDPRLDTTDEGPVEVRADDPTTRLEAYRSGAVDPDDDVLAALATGSDAPLAAVLGWEYARRAAAAGVWDTVVAELDGDLAAVRRIAAAGDLSAFVESRWPAHVRFASMAAGDRADSRVREAHRMSLLATDVSDFLAGPIEVVAVGSAPGRTVALAELARGAVTPSVAPDGSGGYRMECPVPAPPVSSPTVEGDGLRLEHHGFRALLPLPALLSRCVLVASHFDPGECTVVATFVPDPDLWPPNLVPTGSADRSG
jgi:arsenite-transporting ATPase